MAMSFRTARNSGLMILLLIIFAESIFSYVTIAQNSRRLNQIITIDDPKLRRWHDIAEIVAEAKHRLYEFQAGKREVVAPVDLLINRALAEVKSIRALATDENEIASIDVIEQTAKKLKQAIYAYEVEVRHGYRGGASAKEMEEIATKTADRIAQLSREGAAYVSKRIEDEKRAILEVSSFSKKTLGGVLALAVIATVVNAVFMAKALARPIKELLAGTQRLASGDLGHRVIVESEDDIGQLARSFNAMAEELRRSQHELLTAKAYTDNIIKSMTNSLVVVDQEFIIKTVNLATCDLLGYSEHELIGSPLTMIFADGRIEAAGLDRVKAKGFANHIETVYLAKDGARIRVLFSGSMVRGDQEDSQDIVCVAQDVTMQAEAMRAGHLASLGEMAAGVAHEINNPINSIINFAQIMLDDAAAGQPATPEMLTRIIKEGDRVAGIVSSLLSFAREGEKVKKPVRVSEVLDETLALVEAQLRKDGMDLHVEIPAALPLITAHFQQIQQVFLNIINNARYALNKRFPSADPGKSLRIGAKEVWIEEIHFLETFFLDQGTGIPAEVIDKVINPFFSTKPTGRGTGLGLAISHGIVTDHQGKLIIESKEGHYTRVRVLLPIEATQKP
ncbi:MAG: HAMP domain-containing protein [Desulfobacteraceae bacterium]|nr:MAG: HAMP domain-containing protein [Desulfobacteraceae bacterium]